MDDWQWIYEESTTSQSTPAAPNPQKRKASDAFSERETGRIIGARRGSDEVRLGDAVLLKAARNEQWVALIYEFLHDDIEDEKEARFLWFTSPKEIRNKAKRRNDAMSVCNYT